MSFHLKAEIERSTAQIPGGNLTTKGVLINLASYADNTGSCWPSYDSIAQRMNASRRTVIRHIGVLVKAGLVIKEHRKRPAKKGQFCNRSNMYKIVGFEAKNTAATVTRGGDSVSPRTCHTEQRSLKPKTPLPPFVHKSWGEHQSKVVVTKRPVTKPAKSAVKIQRSSNRAPTIEFKHDVTKLAYKLLCMHWPISITRLKLNRDIFEATHWDAIKNVPEKDLTETLNALALSNKLKYAPSPSELKQAIHAIKPNNAQNPTAQPIQSSRAEEMREEYRLYLLQKTQEVTI
jgi:DNA-binding transcriptional ArsR family regulator/uncharacterized protein (DUF1919 family)